MDKFEAKRRFLTLLSAVEARASDDATHSQESDYEGHGDSHGCVQVILYKPQLKVADATIEQSHSKQH